MPILLVVGKAEILFVFVIEVKVNPYIISSQKSWNFELLTYLPKIRQIPILSAIHEDKQIKYHFLRFNMTVNSKINLFQKI